MTEPDKPTSSKQKYRLSNNGINLFYDVSHDNNRLTQQTIAEKSGISLGGVKKILTSLRRKSLLSREGSDKAGHWVVLYDYDTPTDINPI